jgi:frataxin
MLSSLGFSEVSRKDYVYLKLKWLVRYFSGSTNNDTSETSFSSEAEYDLAAETFLEDLNTALEPLDIYFPEFDIFYAQGVMTMQLGDQHGTYVLNKQRPNMQIWWSSPTSGPKRFEFDGKSGVWKSSRHGEELLAMLKSELLQINPEIEIDFSDI